MTPGEVEVLAAPDGAPLGQSAVGLQAQAVVGPAADEPLHVLGDGIHVLDVLLGRVGVVHAQVADAAELAGDAEVEADGLGVADVQVAVRLGRKARDHLADATRGQVLLDDLAEEVLALGTWLALALRLPVLGHARFRHRAIRCTAHRYSSLSSSGRIQDPVVSQPLERVKVPAHHAMLRASTPTRRCEWTS